MSTDLTRIWYVSGQRLCNFTCHYCVSINDYAKSNNVDWASAEERDRFLAIVDWLGTRPYPVGIRLATLGEPFASRTFLDRAAWLTRRDGVRFVELVTNGSLLLNGLGRMEPAADLSKVSLWVTHHATQIAAEKLITNACLARDRYGCFVVVNALLFPDNIEAVRALKRLAADASLRFNLDLGYNPLVPFGALAGYHASVPVTAAPDWFETALDLGANEEVLRGSVSAMNDLSAARCRAGHDYFYIGIHGDAYPCSRYQVLKINRLGNVLDEGFEFPRARECWRACQAGAGCCNKEDFLNIEALSGARGTAPSLGWTGT